MVTALLAASSSGNDGLLGDLLKVIGVGAAAGIGVSIAFALMIRGFLVAGIARREGRQGAALASAGLGALCAVICVAAVGGGLFGLLHR